MNEDIQDSLSREAAHEAEDPRFKPNVVIILLVVLLSWMITIGALLYAWNSSEQDATRGTNFAAEVERACKDEIPNTDAITRLCEGAEDVVDKSDIDPAQGPRGLQGIQGTQGVQGPEGDQGPRGFTGDQGPRGFRGPDGPAGATGPTGQPGEPGPAGDDGTDGASGSDGLNGENGENGEDGVPGPKGDKGDKGETGDPGPQGATGPAGADGQPGADGAPGTPGRGIQTVTCDPETEQFVITYTDGTVEPIAGSDCIARGPVLVP